MRIEAGAGKRIGGRRCRGAGHPGGGGSGGCGRERGAVGGSLPGRRIGTRGGKGSVAVLEFLPAAAGAGFVAPRHRCGGGVALGHARERLRLGVVRPDGDDAPGQRRRGGPLAERDAVLQQRERLRRACDGIGKRRRQRSQLGSGHDPAEIEQSMKAERPADRVRGFEREPVGERLVAEDDAVLALEQCPVRAADRRVLRVHELDARIGERVEQALRAQREAAVAHPHVVVPGPLRAEIVAAEERGVPGRRD